MGEDLEKTLGPHGTREVLAKLDRDLFILTQRVVVLEERTPAKEQAIPPKENVTWGMALAFIQELAGHLGPHRATLNFEIDSITIKATDPGSTVILSRHMIRAALMAAMKVAGVP